jgi:Icc-related predicted phosphoesterase
MRRPNSPTHHPTNSPIVFGAFGDIHGDFAHARRAVERHPDVRFWVSVGDIATDTGAYERLGAPVYWIHGNNDNFDAIASGAVPEDFHYIANGTVIDVGRVFGPGFTLRIAGLGGTFAPTWYETPASDLPHPKKGSARATELADKRRHFVRDEVNACKRLRGVDVFLTHEAAKPFRPFPGGRGPDAGKEAVNEVLREMKPRLHLFGHHHRFSTQTREGVESIGLDLVSRSYLTIDAGSLKYVCHANA